MPPFSMFKQRFFLFSIAIYLTALLIYGFWVHFHNEKVILENIDKKLYNHAVLLKYIIPEDFHDRAMDAQSIPISEDKHIANKLTEIVKETGFKYSYTIIRNGEKLFFVASDLIEDPHNERGTFYYYEYEGADKSFYDAFQKVKPTYKTVSDKWGTVRTIMVPEESPGGRKYLSCVDYDITYVEGLLRDNLFKSIGTIVFFLILTIPIILAYTNSYKDFLNHLRESEARYRRLTENAKDLIYRMSLPDGKYEYVSPAVETISGYPPETWYENPTLINTIIHPDFVQYFKEKREQLTKGVIDPVYEYQIITKRGDTRWIHQRNVGVRDNNGKLTAIEGIATDITDIKHTEKSLQESHQRLLTVLNSIDATVYVADIQTHEILFMNQHMIESFGRDMTGEICWEVFRDESGPCSHCPNNKLIDKDGKPKGVHIWQTRNPITQKWYINHDRAIEWTNGRLAKLQIATDITEIKRMEEELRQAHKMESIGMISGGIAHDFNNILGIIMGNTELAIADLPEWSPAQNNLQEIKTAVFRAKDIVSQLLSFSRKTEQDFKNIKLIPIIKESMKLIRASIPTTIDIHLHVEDIQGVIKADPTQIHQILINICTNASHAMEEHGGTLAISLSEIELDSRSQNQFPDVGPGTYVQLEISDTGTGIDSSISEKIFDPYFTTKEIGSGSGMGLAVVHGIVKSHKGSISFNSEPMKGTNFKIIFPSVDGEPDKEENVSIDNIFAEGGKILFVDDEEALARMGAEMLKLLGYEVVYLINPLKALDMIKDDPDQFDLIITDMTMPLMTGDKFAKEILEINPDIPIILCTGYSNKIDSESALRMGIRQYINKPLSLEQLAKTVKETLSGFKDKTN